MDNVLRAPLRYFEREESVLPIWLSSRYNRMTRNDILIIGAGPSGLFAAGELARHGVSVRLIEREVQPHRLRKETLFLISSIS